MGCFQVKKNEENKKHNEESKAPLDSGTFTLLPTYNSTEVTSQILKALGAHLDQPRGSQSFFLPVRSFVCLSRQSGCDTMWDFVFYSSVGNKHLASTGIGVGECAMQA